VDPVLGGIVEEGQQPILVVGDFGDGLGPLDAIVGGERLDRRPCMLQILGQEDLVERLAGAGVDALGQRTQNIPDLVKP
jgi:hypothetical protein